MNIVDLLTGRPAESVLQRCRDEQCGYCLNCTEVRPESHALAVADTCEACRCDTVYAPCWLTSGVSLVSRHPAALDWMRKQFPHADIRMFTHMTDADMAGLDDGDVVVGTLPIHLAAEVCKRSHFVFLSLDTPQDLRGEELVGDDFERRQPRLVEYRVEKVG